MPRRNLSLLLPHARATDKDPIISGVTEDPRAVGPGNLYAALPHSDIHDYRYDGRQFIEQAIAAGAAAILTQTGTSQPASCTIPFITSDNARQMFGSVAATFFGEQPKMLAAVTGTNGKTSTAQFLRDLWAQAGQRAASIGTLGLVAPHLTRPSGGNTTPDPATLYRTLAMLVENSVSHCVFEASSHALDQYRVHAAKIKVAGLTNMTGDHLDYHGSLQNYRAVKMRLFTEVLPLNATAVINADTPEFAFVYTDITKAGRNVVSYGHAGADITLLDTKRLGHGQRLTLRAWDSLYTVDLPLIGQFQAENALCALGMAVASGEPATSTVANLTNLAPVRGRLERVGNSNVYVDYAHTPDALENALKTLRPHTSGKLHVVFGCGGNRDPAKRPAMGRIAAALADHVIVTDDNPRHENPAAIRAGIMAAASGADEIPSRSHAIMEAIAAMKPGDVLLVAGKGHEQGQTVGDDVIPFDDAEIVRFALGQPLKVETA
ncbi:MAG: UDP-N-acetylmuramoyl-L-alanyl-D-glutamate--2,6-diaminopimelate ligase [Bdellovibrionales bacterium]